MPKKDDIKIVDTEQAEQLDPNLPPAGWKRDEELAQRTDNLAQAAEEATNEHEIHHFDPSKFDPEREIQQHMNELNVENARPERRYFWCYEGQNGRWVNQARRLGWTVVQSADTEAPTLKDARGYRVIGDTVLMWTTVANYEKLQFMQEYRELRRAKGIGTALKELGEKHRDKGFVVHDDASEVKLGRKQEKTAMDVMKQRAAQRAAAQGVDNMLREGTVPNMPAPGGRRR